MKKLSKTNINDLKKVQDKNIDYSDIPVTSKAFWEDSQILYGTTKKPVSIRLDEDVINWFKSFGKGYQTKINEVLKTYMQSIKKQQS